MKRNSLVNSVFYSACCGLLMGSLIGCGGQSGTEPTTSQAAPTTESSTGDQATTATVENSPAPTATEPSLAAQSAEPQSSSERRQTSGQHDLHGVWYGEAVFDVDAYNARMSQLDPVQAARLQEMVGTFSTIIMGAEFRADSVMELDMMLTAQDGQALRDRTVGTWKVRQTTPISVTIETAEYKNNEQQPVQKVYVYQFIDQDHFQFIPDSISPELREFSPRIVFQRVKEPLAEAAVAEEPTSPAVR